MPLKGFPENGQCYLVKWIDGIHPPLGLSETRTISITLQPLDGLDPRRLPRLTMHDVRAILRQRPDSLETVRVQAGELPFVHIGDVFKDGRPVGRLPSVKGRVVVPESQPKSISAPIPPVGLWKSKKEHLVLNRYEYSCGPAFGQSKAIVASGGGATFIIPCAVVFQSLYGLDTDLTNIFLSGPWDEDRKARVFSFDTFESGIATRTDPATGDWHVVLQPEVHSLAYVPLLSWLHFDAYAETAAMATWNAILMARLRYRSAMAVFETLFPYPEADIDVQGFEIKSDGAEKKILVIRITRCRIPDGPPIFWARPFGPGPAEREEIVDEEFRHTGKRTIEGSPDDIVANDVDAAPAFAGKDFEAPACVFENYKLHQQISKVKKHFQHAATMLSQPDAPTLECSAGEVRPGGIAKADVQQKERDDKPRFIQMYNGLKTLEGTGFISSLAPVPATDSRLRIPNSELELWSFPQFEDRSHLANRFRRYWVPHPESGSQLRIKRAAFVLGFDLQGVPSVLIEIGGPVHDPFLATVIWGVNDLCEDVVTDALAIIAMHSGRSFGLMLSNHVANKYAAQAWTVKHHMLNGALNLNALRKQLQPP